MFCRINPWAFPATYVIILQKRFLNTNGQAKKILKSLKCHPKAENLSRITHKIIRKNYEISFLSLSANGARNKTVVILKVFRDGTALESFPGQGKVGLTVKQQYLAIGYSDMAIRKKSVIVHHEHQSNQSYQYAWGHQESVVSSTS